MSSWPKIPIHRLICPPSIRENKIPLPYTKVCYQHMSLGVLYWIIWRRKNKKGLSSALTRWCGQLNRQASCALDLQTAGAKFDDPATANASTEFSPDIQGALEAPHQGFQNNSSYETPSPDKIAVGTLESACSGEQRGLIFVRGILEKPIAVNSLRNPFSVSEPSERGGCDIATPDAPGMLSKVGMYLGSGLINRISFQSVLSSFQCLGKPHTCLLHKRIVR